MSGNRKYPDHELTRSVVRKKRVRLLKLKTQIKLQERWIIVDDILSMKWEEVDEERKLVLRCLNEPPFIFNMTRGQLIDYVDLLKDGAYPELRRFVQD